MAGSRSARERLGMIVSWLFGTAIGVVWVLQPIISGSSAFDWAFALVVGVPVLVFMLRLTPRVISLLPSPRGRGDRRGT